MYKSISILKDKNEVTIAVDTEKAFWQNLILHNKSPEEIRNRRNKSQHSKSCIWQIYGWHYPTGVKNRKHFHWNKKTSVSFLHSYSIHNLKPYQQQEYKRKKYKEKLKRKPSILICRCCNSRHKTHKYSIRKLLSLIDTLRKVVRQKINRHKYTMTNKTEEELEEMITFAIT